MRTLCCALACALAASGSARAATQTFHRTIELSYDYDERHNDIAYRSWHPIGRTTFPTFNALLGTLTGAKVRADTYLRTRWDWDFSIGEGDYTRPVSSTLSAYGGIIVYPEGGDALVLLDGMKELSFARELRFGEVGQYDSGFVYAGSGETYEFHQSLLDALQVPGTAIAEIDPFATFGLDECEGHTIHCGPVAVHLQFTDEIDLTYVYTPSASVPEPGTWALMVCGLGLAGWAMRTVRRVRET